MALLELSDISVQYGEIEALRGVSLSIEEGAVIALLGANGAVLANQPEASIVTVEIGGQKTTLGRQAAEKILVGSP